ncbi:hypothetical protein CONLIGDRAFT_343599 [Coniochaeta ligniaria NRRL 30616]|uniref:Uncharacterized protein n=1 Tax=Coniochaeta ligniaria NRRL 30616 TaxID=1408157 RepID=A0A1J7JPS4_9PEZI|nr:hypothetical protein CONLIGDRAFT_343599 [Coniochaeta ligniaria NRRL 30616]
MGVWEERRTDISRLLSGQPVRWWASRGSNSEDIDERCYWSENTKSRPIIDFRDDQGLLPPVGACRSTNEGSNMRRLSKRPSSWRAGWVIYGVGRHGPYPCHSTSFEDSGEALVFGRMANPNQPYYQRERERELTVGYFSRAILANGVAAPSNGPPRPPASESTLTTWLWI